MTAGWKLADWPFLEASHHALAAEVGAWNRAHPAMEELPDAQTLRSIAASLGAAGLLRYVIPPPEVAFDSRALCTIREGLTYHSGIADSLFAMQGIGTLAIQRYGSAQQKARYLPACRAGERIAALALTEPDAGSDVASLATTARSDGDGYRLDGDKTLITNAGIADHYLVMARTGEADGTRGLSVFLVDAQTPGLSVGPAIEFMAPHPGAGLTLRDCRVRADALLGTPGNGFKIIMSTFDVFRPSVGAAAVGLARRALEETLARVTQRKVAGKPMSQVQSIQMMLADMVSDVDTAALTVYRAAWELDVQRPARSYAPSLAKLCATEAAGRVVDKAVQLHGGAGVTRGNVIEQLYREARAMRIYEGASEIQKLIVGRQLIADFDARAD